MLGKRILKDRCCRSAMMNILHLLYPLGLFARKRESGKKNSWYIKTNVFAKREPSFGTTLKVHIMSPAL